MNYTCDVSGCLSYASYYVVWGCLEGHLRDMKLCLPCTRSHQEKIRVSHPRSSREFKFICNEKHVIADMLVFDPENSVTWDAEGKVVYR